jgi:hypothetical protein
VPNPTSATLVRAGGLEAVTSRCRLDQDPGAAATSTCDPHGFLLDPRISVPARTQGQLRIATFFQSGGATILDPDGPLPVWEVPVANPGTLETLNFSTRHSRRHRRPAAPRDPGG